MSLSLESVPPTYHLPGFHEPVSAISHLAGAVYFLVFGVLLIRRGRGILARQLFLAGYVAALVFLFSMSGVFHMLVPGHTARSVLQRLDHAAIFVLIAGSFLPAHGILFRGVRRWAPLLVIYAAAITGITLKATLFDQFPEWAGLTFYLALGWMGVFSGAMIIRAYGLNLAKPLLWGGIVYSAGAVLDYLKWPVVVPGVIGPHELFHLAVLLGAYLQWQFAWRIAQPSFVGRNRLN